MLGGCLSEDIVNRECGKHIRNSIRAQPKNNNNIIFIPRIIKILRWGSIIRKPQNFFDKAIETKTKYNNINYSLI